MSKNIGPLVIVLAVIIALVAGVFFLSNQKTENQNSLNLIPTMDPSSSVLTSKASSENVIISPTAAPTAEQSMSDNFTTTADGLKIQDEVVGTGDEAKSGSSVTVNYLGTLENGTKFDSSYDRNTPFTTQIGVGQVIQGWDEGIVGMKVGGKRKLVIPPSLGYGSQDMGAIPPNSTLIFEVELLAVK